MRHLVIVGGGIAGLAAAFFARRHATQFELPLRVTLLEAHDRLGGKVGTRRRDGFVLEAGPDGFVPHKPAALALVQSLGLAPRLLRSNDQHRGIAFVRGGRAVPLPRGMELLAPPRAAALLRSPLLSWRGKLRLLAERWVPAGRSDQDLSIAAFVRRRCGTEVLERIAEPLLSSLHVGDIERMSLHACCASLAALEQRHGSLTRAAAVRAERAGSLGTPTFWSLRNGMAEVVDALEQCLGTESLHRGCAATGLGRAPAGRFRLATGQGPLAAGAVVLAMPAAAAATLLRRAMPMLACGLCGLRTASVAVVSLGFGPSAAPSPTGFGFFAPRREGLRVLGGTWTSVKFSHRAPDGCFLARLFLGGAHAEQLVGLGDKELERVAREDLRIVTGVRAAPMLTQVERWPAGYPQYDVGHAGRVHALEAACPPGLFLAGSAFHGVGVPDCIASGARAAAAAVGHLAPGASAVATTPADEVPASILG